MRKWQMPAFSAALLVLLLLGTLFAATLKGQSTQEKVPEQWQGDVAALERRYAAVGKPEELLALIKAVLYETQARPSDALREKAAHYGGLLLDLAREEAVDLETMDDPEEMTLLLAGIRAAGAR